MKEFFTSASGRQKLFAAGAAVLVLAGGFALRWCVVEAGMHPVLTTAGLG